MASKKQPYIPLYIGDWERKTNSLSLEAEAAWLKLTFKLWDSKTRGLLSICFSQFVILCKKPPEKAREIWDELVKSGVFDLLKSENDNFEIASRRMLRELELSRVRSHSGSKGGRPKKAKGNQTETKLKPKAKQIPDNDNDIDTDIKTELELGGAGGRGKVFSIITKETVEGWRQSVLADGPFVDLLCMKGKISLNQFPEVEQEFFKRKLLTGEWKEWENESKMRGNFLNWMPIYGEKQRGKLNGKQNQNGRLRPTGTEPAPRDKEFGVL